MTSLLSLEIRQRKYMNDASTTRIATSAASCMAVAFQADPAPDDPAAALGGIHAPAIRAYECFDNGESMGSIRQLKVPRASQILNFGPCV